MAEDIWYREYLAVAAQLDAMTQERDAAVARAERVQGLLREAYPHVWPGDRRLADDLRARIDAALKGDDNG